MKIFCSENDYKNKKAVKTEYPEAAEIKKVCGGWMVFDTIAEYETWKNQK